MLYFLPLFIENTLMIFFLTNFSKYLKLTFVNKDAGISLHIISNICFKFFYPVLR